MSCNFSVQQSSWVSECCLGAYFQDLFHMRSSECNGVCNQPWFGGRGLRCTLQVGLSSNALVISSFWFLVVMPGATATSSDALCY